ncbi:MAG: ATP-binding protein [Candidatus Hinthialibacter antarcticus]|nr:ATP-binding protein [Candidatus Hinthialibacter antarcticus]
MNESAMTNHKDSEAVFPATVEALPNICRQVCDAAKAFGMVDGNLWKLETAVDEACTNIACYGYKGKSDGQIWIRWRKEGDAFVVVIKDDGQPFDQSKPTNPNLSNDICKRTVGGLGRFIMHKFLDEMNYKREADFNYLTMVKKLDGQDVS